MYPHGDGRRRRVGQPPLAPQHLMGIAQQGPGVMVPMPNQPMQILQQNQHHFPPQASYQPSQQSNYVPPNPYHHQYPQANTQVVLTKSSGNHAKHYREDYKVLKEHNYNPERNKFNYTYHQRQHYSFNGQSHQAPVPKQRVAPRMAYPTKTFPQNKVVTPLVASTNPPSPPPLPKEETPPPDSTTKELSPAGMVTNSKEKTPMCMVNELARFNKVTHQYRLTNEQGPAHKKNFTVTLTLGTEEYTADGASIKKAQHAAAADALNKTAYAHPTPKNNKPAITIGKSNMTPTVELNALAMKRGEPAVYRLIEYPHNTLYQPQQTLTFRRPYGRGGRAPIRPTYSSNFNFVVSLKVGNMEFLGDGCSPQAARHDAAAKALNQLRCLPVPESGSSDEASNPEPEVDAAIKSPVSLVHEIALKRNLSVVFNVVSENGPPHMKLFITECKVGDLKTEGEGNGKKISKKRAAEIMLKELRKLPPLSPSVICSINLSRLKKKPLQGKKKTRNLIKVTQEAKTEVVATPEINPISRLIQIQQMKREKEPVYTLLEEKGSNRRREFYIEVAVGEVTAIGSGPNKKIAKKNAAHNLLKIIDKRPEKSETDNTETKQDNPSGSGGRQLAPGVILVTDKKGTATTSSSSTTSSSKNKNPTVSSTTESANTESSNTVTNTAASTSNTTTDEDQISSTPNATDSKTTTKKGVGSKEQLLYLSKLLNFEVTFSDYPKANHKEHLSLVSLSTDPPQVCHGSAATIEESQNIAAATALRALAEMGLDSVSPTTTNKENN